MLDVQVGVGGRGRFHPALDIESSSVATTATVSVTTIPGGFESWSLSMYDMTPVITPRGMGCLSSHATPPNSPPGSPEDIGSLSSGLTSPLRPILDLQIGWMNTERNQDMLLLDHDEFVKVSCRK